MKRLLIDLDICSKCDDCGMLCSYIQHPQNNGITSLREFAHFAVVCRRCEDAPCVASCPWEALEMQEYDMLKRYMMRCTSCKSCSRACPFGVIYPETIPFIAARTVLASQMFPPQTSISAGSKPGSGISSARTRTSCPACFSAFTTLGPSEPVPPVTRTLSPAFIGLEHGMPDTGPLRGGDPLASRVT